MKIMLSVPHGFCLFKSKQFRHCDNLALPFAISIHEQLREKGLESFIFFPDRLRSDIDMNRSVARETAFRSNLDDKLSLSSEEDVLLDIHSAPGDTLEGCYFDLYVLDLFDHGGDDDFNERLVRYLLERNVEIFHMSGSIENDIIYRSIVDFILKNVSLIEINEDLGHDRVKVLAKKIATFLSKLK